MMMCARRLVWVVVAAMVQVGAAQEWALNRLEQSPRHLEWVEVKHADRSLKAFVAYPEVPDKATAVVVIHEIFGLTDWVRGVADQPVIYDGAGHGFMRAGEAPDASEPNRKARQQAWDRWRKLLQSL